MYTFVRRKAFSVRAENNRESGIVHSELFCIFVAVKPGWSVLYQASFACKLDYLTIIEYEKNTDSDVSPAHGLHGDMGTGGTAACV